MLSLTLTGRARLRSRPTALSSQASTHSSVFATPRIIDPTHFQIVSSILWSHCCEFVVKCFTMWRYQNHLFVFFFGIRTILRCQFWRVIWVFKAWCLCGPESNCREGCLGRHIILMYNPLFFFLSTIIRPFLTNSLC